MTDTAPLLDVRRLSVDYLSASGTVHAVSDVSFTLGRGEVLGLAGESGCGKSTLAHAAARLLEPPAIITGGEVRYHRPAGAGVAAGDTAPIELTRLRERELRALRWNDLAIVFQSAMNALNPVMTVGAQIDDTLRAHRPGMARASRAERARELLALVGIAADRLGSYPHELSGGMRQRATIAIALALAPELIIMDEPTTALDVVVQRDILTELLRLRERLRFSIIFITHDLSLLLEIADRIAIMYAGRIVEQTSARELHRQPRHPYSYGMLHAFPTLTGPRRAMLGIPGAPPDLRRPPAGCAFAPRCPLAFAPCATILPPLLPLAAAPEQLVACHRYDARQTTQALPTDAELAAAYAALGAAAGETPA
ncbi:MAG TPA: ABC transporter ATP-binding protein [Ktedonobacterales bacterium]|nr:ABC transporter ATP-binding protein [Ktedonobacterales bacterium]